MTQHQREEALIRDRTIVILNTFFGWNIHDIYDSKTLIRMMTAEGIKMFSTDGFYKMETIYENNPLRLRIDSHLDYSNIYIYDTFKNIVYNLCGQKMTDTEKLYRIKKAFFKKNK